MRKLIPLVFAAIVVAAFALPALAAGPAASVSATTAAAANLTARSHSHWFAGSVSSVGSGSLTVGVLWTRQHDDSLNGQVTTVSVNSDTKITSGKKRTSISLSDIQAGDLVAVVASGSGSDLTSLTAARIHVYCNCHWIGGTVSAIGTSSVTVQVKRTGPYDTVLSGQAVPVNVDSNTVFVSGKNKQAISLSDLKVGSGVGVVFSADGFFKAPGFDPAKANFTAKRIHLWGHRMVPLASTDASVSAGVSLP
ncbi:MAG TPA: DUF5666 domain-containing protein [Gaiellaceae bacterium]|nr:DUF5666 domain-containing protein [Gaiellaceae bacterium]